MLPRSVAISASIVCLGFLSPPLSASDWPQWLGPTREPVYTETGILSTHMHADGSKKELLWNPVGVSTGFKPEELNAGVRVLMTGNEVQYRRVRAIARIMRIRNMC